MSGFSFSTSEQRAQQKIERRLANDFENFRRSFQTKIGGMQLLQTCKITGFERPHLSGQKRCFHTLKQWRTGPPGHREISRCALCLNFVEETHILNGRRYHVEIKMIFGQNFIFLLISKIFSYQKCEAHEILIGN